MSEPKLEFGSTIRECIDMAVTRDERRQASSELAKLLAVKKAAERVAANDGNLLDLIDLGKALRACQDNDCYSSFE